jgi:hypothetical protein
MRLITGAALLLFISCNSNDHKDLNRNGLPDKVDAYIEQLKFLKTDAQQRDYNNFLRQYAKATIRIANTELITENIIEIEEHRSKASRCRFYMVRNIDYLETASNLPGPKQIDSLIFNTSELLEIYIEYNHFFVGRSGKLGKPKAKDCLFKLESI